MPDQRPPRFTSRRTPALELESGRGTRRRRLTDKSPRHQPNPRRPWSLPDAYPHSSYGPVRLPRGPSPKVTSRARPSSPPGLPRLPVSLFQRAVPSTPADQDGCTCRLLPPPARPSPDHRRVGIRDFTFEACSGFTRITARWIAQPPKAAFVTGLRSIRLPGPTACQLPDQTNNCLGGSFLH